jgi:hypothetical protein
MPPLERPIVWPEVPFCTLSVAVDLDDGGVDHGVFHARIIRHGIDQPLENASFGPIAKAREDAASMAERRRKGAPRPAQTDYPTHRLDKQPVVLGAAPGIAPLTKARRLHLCPSGVCQYWPVRSLSCGRLRLGIPISNSP